MVRASWPSLHIASVSSPVVSSLHIFLLLTAEQVNVLVLIVLCWCGSLPGSRFHLTHRRHKFVCLFVFISFSSFVWNCARDMHREKPGG